MNRKGILANCTLFVLLGLGVVACKTTPDVSTFSVNIRMPNEPDNLHPIFSKSIYAAQIEGLILLPVAEFDPVSLTLSPLLITHIPEGESVIEGEHPARKVFRLEFRPEATWDDGQPVTAEDYLFTFKSVYNPHLNTGSWRAFMDFISAIEIDSQDNKKVSVYLDKPYMLDLQATTNFNIYPAHIYDPENIMTGFSLAELRDPSRVWTTREDSLLKRFALQYESPDFFRETVSGAGPYELDSWVTGEFIRLKRKTDWWGEAIEPRPLLMQAYPSEITYRIILDAAGAEAALKTGAIDLMAEVPASTFNTLRQSAEWGDKFQYSTPALMQVYYLEINNRNPILADPKIRKALAYAIDYDGILSTLLQGFAARTVGPVHPDKSYYHDGLEPLRQDINRSLALIKEAGWEDTNGNGTPDKVIQGQRKELELEIKITNKEEGMATANIIKENAAKAGFNLKLMVVEPGQLQQDIRQHNYDLAPLRISAFPGVDDPFPLWHSSNDKPGGSNRSGFRLAELDKTIEELRNTNDVQTRVRLFKKFQELIYEHQPAIYLYVPLERIIANRNIEVITSIRRPGYFENLLKPAGT